MSRNEFREKIFDAAKQGNLDAVNSCLDEGIDPNITDECHCTPVWHAAANGHVMTVLALALAKCRADVNIPNNRHETPVCIAAANGHVTTVLALARCQANVNTPDCYKRTPVYKAVVNKHVKTVQALVDCGADPNIPDQLDRTPGWRAHIMHQTEMVCMLQACRASFRKPYSCPGCAACAEQDQGQNESPPPKKIGRDDPTPPESSPAAQSEQANMYMIDPSKKEDTTIPLRQRAPGPGGKKSGTSDASLRAPRRGRPAAGAFRLRALWSGPPEKFTNKFSGGKIFFSVG
jgi:hypothetical protein